MKHPIPATIALIFTVACSRPEAWTLWLHSSSLEGVGLDQVSDQWLSFDTHPTLAGCRSETELQLAILEKAQREARQSGLADALKLRLPERNVSVKREEFGLIVTSTTGKQSGGAETFTETFRFSCLPSGKDPRSERAVADQPGGKPDTRSDQIPPNSEIGYAMR